MKLTQHQLIIEYCKTFGSILPAKISGTVFIGQMFGSEISKRCRDLRDPNSPDNPYKRQILDSEKDGRFEKFFLIEDDILDKPNGVVGDWKEEKIKVEDKKVVQPVQARLI